MSSLAETLRDLQAHNGLELAAIVSADGLVVEAAAGDSDLDVESICSVASNGLLMMDALRQELSEETARVVTLEYGRRLVMVSPLDDENLLVLVAGEGANLGRLRIVLRRTSGLLAEALGSF
jgi:predicted regulator of Ras-like GTPase activity (Roadblock/LC7/MglB family)